MSNELVDRFKNFYRELHSADLASLGHLYSSEVMFKDPVHQIDGIGKLEDYMAEMCAGLTSCHFEYLDELVADTSAYIKWIMHFRHPKLGEKTISVRGVSHIQFTDTIHYHEDFYDLGAMFYEQIPILGKVTSWLKKRLAGQDA